MALVWQLVYVRRLLLVWAIRKHWIGPFVYWDAKLVEWNHKKHATTCHDLTHLRSTSIFFLRFQLWIAIWRRNGNGFFPSIKCCVRLIMVINAAIDWIVIYCYAWLCVCVDECEWQVCISHRSEPEKPWKTVSERNEREAEQQPSNNNNKNHTHTANGCRASKCVSVRGCRCIYMCMIWDIECENMFSWRRFEHNYRIRSCKSCFNLQIFDSNTSHDGYDVSYPMKFPYNGTFDMAQHIHNGFPLRIQQAQHTVAVAAVAAVSGGCFGGNDPAW